MTQAELWKAFNDGYTAWAPDPVKALIRGQAGAEEFAARSMECAAAASTPDPATGKNCLVDGLICQFGMTPILAHWIRTQQWPVPMPVFPNFGGQPGMLQTVMIDWADPGGTLARLAVLYPPRTVVPASPSVVGGWMGFSLPFAIDGATQQLMAYSVAPGATGLAPGTHVTEKGRSYVYQVADYPGSGLMDLRHPVWLLLP